MKVKAAPEQIPSPKGLRDEQARGQPPADGRGCSGWWGRQENQEQSSAPPWTSSTSSLQLVSDVFSIKITTGQTQINLTDLTDRVKQAEDRISLNEKKLLAYEKDLKRRIQELTRNLEQIHRTGRRVGGSHQAGKLHLEAEGQGGAAGKAWTRMGNGPAMDSSPCDGLWQTGRHQWRVLSRGPLN